MSKPASARRRAVARPTRLAAPVMRAKGMPGVSRFARAWWAEPTLQSGHDWDAGASECFAGGDAEAGGVAGSGYGRGGGGGLAEESEVSRGAESGGLSFFYRAVRPAARIWDRPWAGGGGRELH